MMIAVRSVLLFMGLLVHHITVVVILFPFSYHSVVSRFIVSVLPDEYSRGPIYRRDLVVK